MFLLPLLGIPAPPNFEHLMTVYQFSDTYLLNIPLLENSIEHLTMMEMTLVKKSKYNDSIVWTNKVVVIFRVENVEHLPTVHQAALRGEGWRILHEGTFQIITY